MIRFPEAEARPAVFAVRGSRRRARHTLSLGAPARPLLLRAAEQSASCTRERRYRSVLRGLAEWRAPLAPLGLGVTLGSSRSSGPFQGTPGSGPYPLESQKSGFPRGPQSQNAGQLA